MSHKKDDIQHEEHMMHNDPYAGTSNDRKAKTGPAVTSDAIVNHLSHFTKDELLADVESFAQRSSE
jgi:hypothetical protein